LRTDIVAGVEFSQYAVKPFTENEEKTVIETATEITLPTPIVPAIKQSKPVERTEPPTLQYLPDATITITERNQYGYTRPELLPLNKDRAISFLRRKMTVYMLNKDNTEVMANYLSDIQNHDGIFGIAYGAWLNSREYEKQELQTHIPTPDKQETILPPVAEVLLQSQIEQPNTTQLSEAATVKTPSPPPALPVIKSDLAFRQEEVL